MPSNFIKIILAITGLSPALLLLYFLKVFNDIKRISIYISASSSKEILNGIVIFLKSNYFLLLFIILVYIARFIINFAKNNFAIGRIDVKSIKPGDSNFTPMIFTAVPLLVKLYSPNISDLLLVAAFLLAGIILGLVMKSSYHFNLILKLILGYNHYVVQTQADITYLILSKKELINKKELNRYVKLANHMLLDVSDK